MLKLVSEVIDKASTAKSRNEKIAILRENDTPALRGVLKFMFDPTVEYYTAPANLPAYTPDKSPVGLSYNSLFAEYRRLYIFEKKTAVNEARKNEILIQILENVHSSEADLLYNILSGKKSLYKITQNIVEEAFPGLLNKV